MFIPMESRVGLIMDNLIVPESQIIDRFSVKYRSVESFKAVIFNHDTGHIRSPVEIFHLLFQVGYFRVNGDDRIGKLE